MTRNIEGVEAYPLCWPAGRPRNKKARERSRFDTTMAKARDALFNEIRLVGGSYVTLSTNVPVRLDGLPYANRVEPGDPGVAVYFMRKSEIQCFSNDRWDRVKDNLQALRKTIEALRGIERWGTAQDTDTPFTGYILLPDKVNGAWWHVLGVDSQAPHFVIEATYKKLRNKSHPDRGGNADAFNKVQQAYQEYSDQRI